MADNQAVDDAVTEASHESEQDIVQALTPPADLRLQRSYGIYDYSTSRARASPNPTPTTNTDIAAAHRGLQEADACRSKTNQNTDDNDCSSGIPLMTRVAEFMERYDTWKAQRNFGIAPTPVGAIPKRPKVDDTHVQLLTSVGMSPLLQITCPVIKAGFVLEGWLFCEFTIDFDSAVTTISKQIFEKVAMVAANKPTIGMFGYTNITLARIHSLEDVAIFKILVGDNFEPVLGRNALQYFWPGSVESVTRRICKKCNKYIP